MRILHTSDWHLGNRWKDKSREDEFTCFLDWLLGVMAEKKVDALLVSGDIFDNATPSDGILEKFHQFISRADSTGCKNIILTGGNHDGVSQLDASAPLLKRHHAHLVSSLKKDNAKDCLIEVTDADGKAQGLVCAVPFLRVRDVTVNNEEGDYQLSYIRGVEQVYATVAKLAEEWKAEHPSLPVICMGHLPVQGAKPTESTRSVIGYVDCAEPDIFPPVFDYVALGHIHKGYSLSGGRIRYCGSPLAMGVDEADNEHRVVLVETDGSTQTAESIPVPVFVSYVSRTCANAEELQALEDELHQEDSPLLRDKNFPALSLELLYTGKDITTLALHTKAEEWRKLPFMRHLSVTLVQQNESMEVNTEQVGTLTDYNPEYIFNLKLNTECAEMTEERKSDLLECFRTILAEISHN